MKPFFTLPAKALGVGALLVVGLSANAAEDTSFGYACENCSTNWGNISEDYAACFEGTAQSPIAFDRASATTGSLPRLRIRYEESPLSVERLATNFEAFVEAGEGSSIRIGRKRFDLVQFHFHSSSEHVVDGERAPLELHFVHKSARNELAVVGVFIKEGDHFDLIDPLIEALSTVGSTPVGDHVELEAIDVENLLPQDIGSYRYKGSTTTPPCTEGVQWVLLEEPVVYSKEQIEAIQATIRGFNSGFDNNRPIVERNGRPIETDVERDDDGDDDWDD